MNAGEDMRQILNEVTERIRERSAPTRKAYLARIDAMIKRPKGQDRMGCANVAHAFAAMPANDKLRVVVEKSPHIGIITAYNDMLSAHQPYETYPNLIREEARKYGATVQVAGGVQLCVMVSRKVSQAWSCRYLAAIRLQ